MNSSLEDQLREATRAVASAVREDSAPPLRLPATAFHPPRITSGSRRLIAPLAASVAVAALVVTAVAVRNLVISHRSPRTAESGLAIDSVPRYFAAVTNNGTGAEVVSSATGQVLGAITLVARDQVFIAVSATASDRTFIFASAKVLPVKKPHVAPVAPATFYRLTLRPDGHPGRFTELHLPDIDVIAPEGKSGLAPLGTLAVSPDGSRLAVAAYYQPGVPPTGVDVVNLRTGQVTNLSKTYPSRPAVSLSAPSWDAGNRYLAYLKRVRMSLPGQVATIDTDHLGAKTSVTFYPKHQKVHWSGLLVTPDGSRLILAGLAGRAAGSGTIYSDPVIYEVARPSGRPLLHITRDFSGELLPVWASANGNSLIVIRRNDSSPHISAAIYSGGKATPLPLPSGTRLAAW
ncbi:MAG TPA: hypothetical protein VMA95_02975 [Streptosporangiaceae bacterium]|nr:hypothetical protein [Streptosporangiaceae bacterium]